MSPGDPAQPLSAPSGETDRIRRIFDKDAAKYDDSMGRWERILFAGTRKWACSQEGLRVAAHPRAAQFPAPGGKTLLELARVARGNVNVGLSTSVALPGPYRFAFGLIGSDNHFVYGPSVVYVSPSRSAPAQGPYLAPIDSMLVAPQFQSTTVANDPSAIKGIYESDVRLGKPALWAALVLTQTPAGHSRGVGAVRRAQVQFGPERGSAPAADYDAYRGFGPRECRGD